MVALLLAACACADVGPAHDGAYDPEPTTVAHVEQGAGAADQEVYGWVWTTAARTTVGAALDIAVTMSANSDQPTTHMTGCGTAARCFDTHNKVVYLGTGKYRVTWYMPTAGLLPNGGNVQVNAIGQDSNRCKLASSWNVQKPDATVEVSADVLCHNVGGRLADTRFTASFYQASTAASGAYLYSPFPTANSYWAASPWNSAGYAIYVARAAAGVYQVVLGGQYVGGHWGNLQVTAVGSDATHCKLLGTTQSSTTQLPYVSCYNSAGTLVDSAFSLRMSNRDVAGTTGAYLLGGGSPTTVVAADPSSSWSSLGAGRISYSRDLIPGSYSVALSYLPSTGATVHATAIGNNSVFCKASNVFVSGGTKVGVACFSNAGVPVDAAFSLAYSTNEVLD